MSPVNTDVIRKRIALLEKNIGLLEEYTRIPEDQLLGDPTLYGAAVHYMMESIEIVVDIGNHILAEKFSVVAGSYADVIKKLGVHGVVPKAFADDNEAMPKFRNKVVHLYDEVSGEEVYKNLQKAPEILRQFAEYFFEYA
jgi:uncharacterized protein YutE (UPF0331/DUF86 family)